MPSTIVSSMVSTRSSLQTVKLRHPDGTETNVVKGVMMLEAADLVPTFPDHFFAQGKSKEEAVSATQPAAQGEPAAQPENTVTQSESNSAQSENTAAQPENTAAQPDEGAELSSLVPPRSFAVLRTPPRLCLPKSVSTCWCCAATRAWMALPQRWTWCVRFRA